jgi:2'-5' RNA ligase
MARFFVAIEMPKEVREQIRKVQSKLKKLDCFDGKFVDPEIAHMTVKFFGHLEPDELEEIRKYLQSIAFNKIDAKLGKISFFKKETFIKVIWLEIVSDELVKLAKEIRNKTSGDENDFISHVTLARVKSVSDREKLLNAIKNEIGGEPISFTISEFVLKQSVLTEQGPIYTDVEKYFLG